MQSLSMWTCVIFNMWALSVYVDKDKTKHFHVKDFKTLSSPPDDIFLEDKLQAKEEDWHLTL